MLKKFSRWSLGLTAIFIVGAGLRFYDLGGESLWLDEIYWSSCITQPTVQGLIQQQIMMGTHTPANALLLRFIGINKHSSEFAWRLPTALFASFSVILMGLVARSLFGEAAGLAAAFALAVHPLHILKSGREVGDYGQLVFVILLATLVFIAAVRKGAVWRWGLFGVLIGCVLSSHMLSVFVCCWFAGFAVLCGAWHVGRWAMGRRDSAETASAMPLKRVIPCVLAVGFGGLLYSPWYFLVGSKAANLVGGSWAERNLVEMLPAARDFMGGGLLMLILVAVGVYAALRRAPGWGVFVCGWASMAFFVMAVFWWHKTLIRGHYMFASLGAVSILAGLGALQLGHFVDAVGRAVLRRPGQIKEFRWLPVAVACALLVLPATSGLARLYGTTIKEPWRDISRYLAERVSDDDMVICGPPFCHQCLDFYQARLDKPLPLYNFAETMAMSPEKESDLRGKNGRIWFVVMDLVPDEPGVEGRHFKDTSVFSRENERTGASDIRKLARGLMGNGLEADLSLRTAAARLIEGGLHAQAAEIIEERLQSEVPRCYVTFWALLAKAYEGMGEPEKATSAWRKYAEVCDPKERGYYEFLAVDALFKGRRYEPAMREALAYLQRYDYKMAYFVVAVCAERLKDFEKAYEYYVKAADLMPENALMQQCCASYHLAHDKLDEAQKAAERGLQIDPKGFPKLYRTLAGVYEHKGDDARAEEILKQGIQATGDAPSGEPWIPDLVIKLAQLYRKAGKLAEAKSLLREGLAKHPKDAKLTDALKNLR